jgi:hypothetical protein
MQRRVILHVSPSVLTWNLYAGVPGLQGTDNYVNNYKKHQHIIGGFKEKHFLMGEGIFLISWSDLYDLFSLNALDISLKRYFAL